MLNPHYIQNHTCTCSKLICSKCDREMKQRFIKTKEAHNNYVFKNCM